MGKNKLFKFAEITRMDHVLEPTMDEVREDTVPYKGKWNTDLFEKAQPLVLELGCGKGEYSVGLAKKYPQNNFIGVDIKGNRIYVGAKEVEEKNLKNVFFLRTKVDFITTFFEPNEVDEIWLTFSDPQPNKPNKRLTSPSFIERYRKILKPGGIIHLKTDSDLLFEYTETEIKEKGYDCLFSSSDVYRDLEKLPIAEKEILSIQTHYEKLFSEKGAIIKYCKFTIDVQTK